MSLGGGIVVFVCAWWLFFLLALPFGVSPVDEPEKGHDPGAPAQPHLLLKAAIVTVLAIVATYAFYEVAASGLVTFRGGAPF
ncbi:MAG: DUF1467 family protein [Geminicoccaceae bacterium]|nr:DUF1467 family protein [Geminicoccaceae bacterium]